jgi:hypothetical protein
MDLGLPDVAAQFAASAEGAIVRAGGIDLAREAEVDGRARMAVARPLLDALGVTDIDPRADLESAAVAAEMCRVAGRYVVPFPVVGYVMARAGDGIPAALGSTSPLRCDHGDLFPSWQIFEFSGARSVAGPVGPPLGSRLAPFVTDLVQTAPLPGSARREVSYLAVMWASYLLGVVERALELAVVHVKDRVQFGRPLAAMQSVQYQLADATVAVDGLRELTRFALWKIATARDGGLVDAFAARLQALDVTQSVLRLAQQLHGAAGLCDEYDISLLVRHTQPAMRLPSDAEHMVNLLSRTIRSDGFDSLFAPSPAGLGNLTKPGR